jgi:type II secretory pathway component PulL
MFNDFKNFYLLHLSHRWDLESEAIHYWAQLLDGHICASGQGSLEEFANQKTNLPVVVAMPAQQGYASKHPAQTLSRRQRIAAQKHLLTPAMSAPEEKYHAVWQADQRDMTAVAINTTTLMACLSYLNDFGIEPVCLTLDVLLLPELGDLVIAQTHYGCLIRSSVIGCCAVSHPIIDLVLSDSALSATKEVTLVGRCDEHLIARLSALGLTNRHEEPYTSHLVTILALGYHKKTLNLLNKRPKGTIKPKLKKSFTLYWIILALSSALLTCAYLLINNNRIQNAIAQIQKNQITQYNQVLAPQHIDSLALLHLKEQIAKILSTRRAPESLLPLMLGFQQHIASRHLKKTAKEIIIHQIDYKDEQLKLQLETAPQWSLPSNTQQAEHSLAFDWKPLTENKGWLTVTLVTGTLPENANGSH